MANLHVRESVPADGRFIMSTWLRSWRVQPYAGCVPNHLCKEVVRTCVEQLLIRGASFTVCTNGPEPSSRILGWICSEVTREGDAVVHYGYVREAYSQLGVLELLVEGVVGKRPIRYTHRTDQLRRALPDTAIHCPEIARRKA